MDQIEVVFTQVNRSGNEQHDVQFDDGHEEESRSRDIKTEWRLGNGASSRRIKKMMECQSREFLRSV